MKNLILTLMLLSLIELEGSVATIGYAQETDLGKEGIIVDSESAFKYMEPSGQRGRKILFTGKTSPYGKRDVFVMEIGGSNFKNLTDTPDLEEKTAFWIDDSTIAYAVETEKDSFRYFTMDINNNTKKEISSSLYIFYATKGTVKIE